MKTYFCTCSGGDPRDGTHEDWCLTRAETPEQFTLACRPENGEHRKWLLNIIRVAMSKGWGAGQRAGRLNEHYEREYWKKRGAYDEMCERAATFGLEPPAPFLEEQPTPTPNPHAA